MCVLWLVTSVDSLLPQHSSIGGVGKGNFYQRGAPIYKERAEQSPRWDCTFSSVGTSLKPDHATTVGVPKSMVDATPIPTAENKLLSDSTLSTVPTSYPPLFASGVFEKKSDLLVRKSTCNQLPPFGLSLIIPVFGKKSLISLLSYQFFV